MLARDFAWQSPKKQGAAPRTLILVYRFAESLPRGESRNGLRVDLDLLAVDRAAPGTSLPGPRKKGAETHDGHTLALRDVTDYRVEQRIHHFVSRNLADVPRFCRNLDQIGLGHHVWHAFSPDFHPLLRARIVSQIEIETQRARRDFAHAQEQRFMITKSRRRTHVQAIVTSARCARAPGARADPAHVFELGAADAPPHHLASELGGGGREGNRRAREVPAAAQASIGAAGNFRRGARRPGGP